MFFIRNPFIRISSHSLTATYETWLADLQLLKNFFFYIALSIFFYYIHKKWLIIGVFLLLTPLVLSMHNSLMYKTNKNKYFNIKSFKYNLTYVKCSRNFGLWWVVTDIFWLVVRGGWWWIYFAWWWVVVGGGIV